MKTLSSRAWIAVGAVGVVIGVLVFVSAGSIRFWQGWVYLSIFIGASGLITLDLIRRDPALLQRRMRGGPTAERRPTEKFIMFWASLGFIALLVVPALDHRFGWSTVPFAAVLVGDALVAIGFYGSFVVYRVNTFTSATIEVVADQRVISSGPYRVVRHPLYASALLYLAGTPLALGSFWGFVPLAAMVPFLIWRLLDEERFLARNLAGYSDYQRTVRYRLIPYIW